jgi:hypothetical protein
MFGNTVNKAELSEVAKELLRLLEKYQSSNNAARNVLNRSRDLIGRAIKMEIDSPLPKGFFPEEFWEDGDLFALDDLSEAVANFNLLLRGADSVGAIKKSVHDIEKQGGKDEQSLRDRLKP